VSCEFSVSMSRPQGSGRGGVAFRTTIIIAPAPNMVISAMTGRPITRLKTIDDATCLRRRILLAFERRG
jgi:hypothetical protein